MNRIVDILTGTHRHPRRAAPFDSWEENMNLPETRILSVEDDPDTFNWIKIVLRNSAVPAAVSNARSGRDAIDQVSASWFDLCIVDYALPDMTGVQLCSRLRQMNCGVPVIFFSAADRPIDKEKAFAAGAAAFLSKATDLGSFEPTVRRILLGTTTQRGREFSPYLRVAS